jgi:hypothetical protein
VWVPLLSSCQCHCQSNVALPLQFAWYIPDWHLAWNSCWL